MADRPKRSRNSTAPSRSGDVLSSPTKKKLQHDDSELDLNRLLTHSQSKLTTMDIAKVFNASTLSALSSESRAHLGSLLPPTARQGFLAQLPNSHPSQRSYGTSTGPSSSEQPMTEPPTDNIDPSVFTDPHFLAALLTFQDHLYSGWMTEAHNEKLCAFKEGLADGTLHVPYKDEVWSQNVRQDDIANSQPGLQPARQRDSTFSDLIKATLLREGDVLAYKCRFNSLGITVEKDALVQRVAKSGAITLLMQLGTERSLPPTVLSVAPAPPETDMRDVTVIDAAQLENAVLNLDGRVDREKRPRDDAWRKFTIYRWREGIFNTGAVGDAMPLGEDGEIDLELLATMDRGGRDNHGTLHYLRGCCGS